jgi:hypothetical protein
VAGLGSPETQPLPFVIPRSFVSPRALPWSNPVTVPFVAKLGVFILLLSVTLILKGTSIHFPVIRCFRSVSFEELFSHGHLAPGGNGSGRGGLYAGDSNFLAAGGVSSRSPCCVNCYYYAYLNLTPWSHVLLHAEWAHPFPLSHGFSIGRYLLVLLVPNSNQEVGSPRQRKWSGWHDALGVFADKGNAEVILTVDM